MADAPPAVLPDGTWLAVGLCLEQPAALGRDPRGIAPIDTYRHIPGSVLRGALAAAWIREYGPPQRADAARRNDFLHLFEGPVRYGPLFDAASAVVPLSVLRCKYRPEPDCRAFAFDEAEHPGHAIGRPRCGVCGGRTEPGRGDVEFFGHDHAPVTAQTTRVALTDSEQAAERQLFTRRALTAHTTRGPRTLTGYITAPEPDRAAWLLRRHRLRLGGRRSTSGAAAYLAHAKQSVPADPAELVRDGLLTLRLTSPALFVDAAGRPTAHPDTARIAELLGCTTASGVTVERSWVRREHLGGWHALTNLPKPTELAVSAGSVFRLRLAQQPTPEGLARLSAHGLGLRRAEGFGWVELGPWTPRTADAGIDTAARDTAASDTHNGEAARTLAEDLCRLTDEAAWFHDKLRACLADRRRGYPPDTQFLQTRRAEVLDRIDNGRLRTRLEHLAVGDMAALERVVVLLESHLRTAREQ